MGAGRLLPQPYLWLSAVVGPLTPDVSRGCSVFPSPRSYPSLWISRTGCTWGPRRCGVHPTSLDSMFSGGWYVPAVLVRLSSWNPADQFRQVRRFLVWDLSVRISYSATNNEVLRTSDQSLFAICYRSSAHTDGGDSELAFN